MKNSSISTELYQFFAANFHLDWDLEADDWQGIVDNYFNADPAVEPARTLAHEIDDMCTARSESDLVQSLLREVGVSYDPRPAATFREWLAQITARLRKYANEIDGRSGPY